MDRKKRNTLEKYYGKYVIVHGTYMGVPRKNEYSGWKYEPLVGDWLDTRDNEERPDNVESPQLPISPIRFPIKNSLVCNIHGIDSYSSISENHIIVRHDIAKLNGNLNIGDIVELYGVVIKYEREDGSVDYGIDVKDAHNVK